MLRLPAASCLSVSELQVLDIERVNEAEGKHTRRSRVRWNQIQDLLDVRI